LLRGVDIVTISLILIYTFLASVGLSALSLLLATVSRARHWQIVWMVQLILGLFGLFCLAANGVGLFIFEAESVPYDSPLFWMSQGAVLTAYGSYLALSLMAATARIGFASENRSTRLRVAMLIQQALYIGWFAWFWLIVDEDEVFYAYYILAGLHWAVMAALLIGESPEVSQRVRRGLPQSFLGRVLLTWFNPGPSAGYVFAIASLFTLTIYGVTTQWLATMQGRNATLDFRPVLLGLLILCYVAIYAGVGRLMMSFINRFSRPGPMGSFVLSSVLAFLGCLFPLGVQFSLVQYMGDDYTLLQAPNFIWTLQEAVDNRSIVATDGVALLAIAATALLVFGLNLIAAANEVLRVRQAAPQRIAIDEAALHPERFVKHVPRSPFDEDEP
jgi:hypothetical protein